MSDVPYALWLVVVSSKPPLSHPLSVLLLGLATFFYPFYLCRVWRLRTRQPVRQKGPFLVVVS